MKAQNISYTIFFLILFIAGCSIIPPEKKELRFHYKFEKEKVYKYSSIVENKISGQMMGQEFSMTSSAFVDYAITDAELKENMYTLTATFDKFDIKINFPMMGFDDSTVALKDYIGKRVRILVTNLGKTLSVEPIDTVQPSRVQAMASMAPSDLFKHILMQLPDKELDTNSAWKNDIPDTTIRGGIKMVTKQNIEMKVTGTEKKVDFDCWKITTNGVSTIEGSGSQRGNDVTVDGSTKINGSAYIAPKEGAFVFSESSTETDMTTTVTGSETSASTMVISTKIKTILVK